MNTKAYGFVQGGRESLKLMRTQLHTRWSLLCEIAHETEDAVADKLNTQMPVIKDLLEFLERQWQEVDIAIVES